MMRQIKIDPIPFTQETFKQMQVDQERLEKERSEILIRLQAAREMGDLSENGAYKYAKFELRDTDRKLRRLKYLLRYGVIMEKPKNGIIDFGSKVFLKKGDLEISYLIVNEHESDPSAKKLSAKSPLGSQLMGKKAGENIIFKAPAGVMEYHIISVE